MRIRIASQSSNGSPISTTSRVDDDAIWKALARTAAIFPLPKGLTRIAVPTLIDAVSGISKELTRDEFVTYSYNAITREDLDEKRVLSALQVRKTKLIDRLKAAELQEGDFQKARWLDCDWEILRAGAVVKEASRWNIEVAFAGTPLEHTWNAVVRMRYLTMLDDLVSPLGVDDETLAGLLLTQALSGSNKVAEALVATVGPCLMWQKIADGIESGKGTAMLPALLAAAETLVRQGALGDTEEGWGLYDVDATKPAS